VGNAAQWIESLKVPSWDEYFMGMVFLAAMRSPDQETKQGCIIADWDTKIVLGTGYNGHPRNATPPAGMPPLPTKRPDKYPVMVHADCNAIVNCRGTSNNAVVYLSMPPCEVCFGLLANMPFVKVNRIVFLEPRGFPNTFNLSRYLPHIALEQYAGPHPSELLHRAAEYATLRTDCSRELTSGSVNSYR
jgi:dCMP deaminase